MKTEESALHEALLKAAVAHARAVKETKGCIQRALDYHYAALTAPTVGLRFDAHAAAKQVESQFEDRRLAELSMGRFLIEVLSAFDPAVHAALNDL